MKQVFLILLLASCAWAQGGWYSDKALGRSTGNAVVVVPGATIKVCTDSVCNSPISLYSDQALSNSEGISVTADANGNFGFFAVPGVYFCQVASPGFTTSTTNCQVSPGVAVDTFSNQTISGSKSFKAINNRQMCDQFAGATFDAKVNACIAAVIAQGGGIADATGLLGVQSQTAEIDVGNASSVPVTLLLNDYLNDTVTMTSLNGCAFRVFDGSRLIGHLEGIGTGGTNATIRAAGTTNTGSLVCSDGVVSGGSYVTVSGILLYNPNGATFTNGIVYAFQLIDGSLFSNLEIANYGGIGLRVRAACCHVTFRNITIDGNHTAGSIPLQIDSLSGDIESVFGVFFHDLTVNHPGSGQPNIKMTNTVASSSAAGSVDFQNLYMEGNNTDTTTSFVKIDSFLRTSWSGVIAQSRSAASTQHVWSNLATSLPGLRPRMSVRSFNFQNSSQTLPAPVIDDANYSSTINSDSDGVLANYDNRNAYQAATTYLEQSAGSVEAVAGSNTEVCYGDSSAHALECSYNNGAFSKLPLAGIANTWTAAQTIGSGGSINGPSGLLFSPTAPTISAHFNTSGDSISANNGTAAFTVTVGTGTAGSTGAVGLPTAATGWVCTASNRNRGAYIQQTGSSTTTATFTNYGTTVGTPVNWTNSDVLAVSCLAY